MLVPQSLCVLRVVLYWLFYIAIRYVVGPYALATYLYSLVDVYYILIDICIVLDDVIDPWCPVTWAYACGLTSDTNTSLSMMHGASCVLYIWLSYQNEVALQARSRQHTSYSHSPHHDYTW